MFGKKKDKKPDSSVPISPKIPKPSNDIQKGLKKENEFRNDAKMAYQHLTARLQVQSNLTGQ